MPKRSLIPIIATILLATAATATHAQTITGKVIGIADGDTITVLRQSDKTQHKIRLYGIDCPESHQDCGTRAKQFVSDLVFSKDVRVVQKGMDRYGRVVGIVYLGDICINEEIIKAGFAWVYTHYYKDIVCQDWEVAGSGNETFYILQHMNVIPPELAEKMLAMVWFRNRESN